MAISFLITKMVVPPAFWSLSASQLVNMFLMMNPERLGHGLGASPGFLTGFLLCQRLIQIESLSLATLDLERRHFGLELVTNVLPWLFQMSPAVVERRSRDGIMVNQLK